jgi:hypothetical protein
MTLNLIGYGARVPTERNKMSLPANVPRYRHPLDTERFLHGRSSVQRIKVDEQSQKRNADQILRQTSGEIGLHYLGFDPEPIRLNKKPLHETKTNLHPTISKDHKLLFEQQTAEDSLKTSERIPTNKNYNQHGSIMNRSFSANQTIPSSSSYRNHSNSNFHQSLSTEEKRKMYLETLNSLDKSFDRHCRQDLLTAALPPKPMHELVFVATSNHHAAMQSKVWSEKLRRDL